MIDMLGAGFEKAMPMDEYSFMDITKLMHCGVYCLRRKGEVVYVGKSKKPMVRLSTHIRNRGKELAKSWAPDTGPALNGKGINFDGIWFLPCMLGQLDTLENHMIRKYLPRHNTKGKPPLAIPEDIKVP